MEMEVTGVCTAFPKLVTARGAAGGAIARRSSRTAATVVAHGGGMAARSRASLNLAETATALVITSRLLDGLDARVRGCCASAVVPDLNALVAEVTPSETLWCRTFDNNGSVAEGLPAGTVRA